jgi:hypothetical protein
MNSVALMSQVRGQDADVGNVFGRTDAGDQLLRC